MARLAVLALALLTQRTAVSERVIAVFRENFTSTDEYLASLSGSGLNVTRSFRVGRFAAFVADVDSLETLRLPSEAIAFVERDIPLRLKSQCDSEKAPSWGLQRTSETKLPLDGTYK